jgi:ABC-2 type transport system ATP-binding protein
LLPGKNNLTTTGNFMSQPDLVINTKGLTKMYGSKAVVEELVLAVKRGIVYGFLGPNGAGKTTTIRMLLGLIKPSAGSAQILGHDIVRERHLITPRIAAIVESPAFYPYLTGQQNLNVLARTSNLIPESASIKSLMAKAGLKGSEHKLVRAYSLGMKQRLGIAAALLNNPEVIFLDEPTNGLDPAGIIEMRGLLRHLATEEKRTIFLSSHLLSEVEQVCDEVAVLTNGRVKIEGEVKQLLNAESVIVIKASPFLKAQTTLRQCCSHVRADVSTEMLYVFAPEAAVPDLVRVLVSAGTDIHQISYHRRSLEDIFLDLTMVSAPKAMIAHTK